MKTRRPSLPQPILLDTSVTEAWRLNGTCPATTTCARGRSQASASCRSRRTLEYTQCATACYPRKREVVERCSGRRLMQSGSSGVFATSLSHGSSTCAFRLGDPDTLNAVSRLGHPHTHTREAWATARPVPAGGRPTPCGPPSTGHAHQETAPGSAERSARTSRVTLRGVTAAAALFARAAKAASLADA